MPSLLKTFRRMPAAKLLVLGDIVILARKHAARLEPDERRRLLALLRQGRGRPRNLSEDERAELATLVAKADPRLFAGQVADKFSPVPLPRWVVHGRRGRR